MSEEVVQYDHKKVRCALDRVMEKYPIQERYPRMLAGAEALLARAEKYGRPETVQFQKDYIEALKKDGR